MFARGSVASAITSLIVGTEIALFSFAMGGHVGDMVRSLTERRSESGAENESLREESEPRDEFQRKTEDTLEIEEEAALDVMSWSDRQNLCFAAAALGAMSFGFFARLTHGL